MMSPGTGLGLVGGAYLLSQPSRHHHDSHLWNTCCMLRPILTIFKQQGDHLANEEPEAQNT